MLHVIERPESAFDRLSRPGVGATGAALLHAVVIALVFAISQLGPKQDVIETRRDPTTLPLTWIPHDPGGGHESGGNRSTTPARRQQSQGTNELSIPRSADLSTTSSIEATTEPIPIPAKPVDAGISNFIGAITSERPGDSPGANLGPGGDGDGKAIGPGQGRGPGIGPGVGPGGPGVTTPVVIIQVKPQYTPEAVRAKVQGLVGVECVVLADGTVGDARVIRSLDPVFGLDDTALAAAKRWRFKPGLMDGKPVPVIVTIELSFTLR